MHSAETKDRFQPSDRNALLTLARNSIDHGLTRGRVLHVDSEDYPENLRQVLACFVTLNKNGQLRGCIGHLEASKPLVKDVVENAYSAAFRDPRFPALTRPELPKLEIHISILSPPEPMTFHSEQDLANQVRPGKDGLIMEVGAKRGTFLPSVWESLPDTPSFLQHLKLKSGLDVNFWSDDIKVYRYTTESFSELEMAEQLRE